MLKTAERLAMVGIGTLALVAERTEGAIRRLTEKGETKREEMRNLLRELAAKGEQKKADLLSGLCREIHQQKEGPDLVTRAEIEELKARIARLEERLAQE